MSPPSLANGVTALSRDHGHIASPPAEAANTSAPVNFEDPLTHSRGTDVTTFRARPPIPGPSAAPRRARTASCSPTSCTRTCAGTLPMRAAPASTPARTSSATAPDSTPSACGSSSRRPSPTGGRRPRAAHPRPLAPSRPGDSDVPRVPCSREPDNPHHRKWRAWTGPGRGLPENRRREWSGKPLAVRAARGVTISARRPAPADGPGPPPRAEGTGAGCRGR